MVSVKTNQTDQLLEEIADYVLNKEINSEEAIKTAHHVLIDTIGCGILALNYPECTAVGTNCTRDSCSKWGKGAGHSSCA